jgi:hypothetical protein
VLLSLLAGLAFNPGTGLAGAGWAGGEDPGNGSAVSGWAHSGLVGSGMRDPLSLVSTFLLVPKSYYGIEPGRLAGGPDAEDDSHDQAEADGNDDRCRVEDEAPACI